jgi:hypothetical protein
MAPAGITTLKSENHITAAQLRIDTVSKAILFNGNPI